MDGYVVEVVHTDAYASVAKQIVASVRPIGAIDPNGCPARSALDPKVLNSSVAGKALVPVTLCQYDLATTPAQLVASKPLADNDDDLDHNARQVLAALAEVRHGLQDLLESVDAQDLVSDRQAQVAQELQRREERGKKTAERLIVEMKDKVGAGGATALPGVRGPVPADPVTEASVALQALGYKPAEVSKLVSAAAAPGDSAEAIIRKALKSALRAS